MNAESETPAAGIAPRQCAVRCLSRILTAKALHDDVIGTETSGLASRDRRFVSAIVFAALRHKGEIDAVLDSLLSKPLPPRSGITRLLLTTAAAQLLFMGLPAHGVIDTSVEIAKQDSQAKHFSGLLNAVLRKMAALDASNRTSLGGPELNVPAWAWTRWVRNYGRGSAARIAAAHCREPSVDVSCKAGPADWSRRLGGTLLPNGSLRLPPDYGSIEMLDGYSEGYWWVQDAAAALPVRLLGDVAGRPVLDLCAAPGGKTMQLAAAGARVTAVDRSEKRLERLRENLARTSLTAELAAADAGMFESPGLFDGVLLDAPCSATGTVRRHPELLHIKDESQIGKLSDVQGRLLKKAAQAVKPGGLLVYCTCSLEPEEGEDQISAFLEKNREFVPIPVEAGEGGIAPEMITAEGFLRTMPSMTFGAGEGMDGFFAARLRRLS